MSTQALLDKIQAEQAEKVAAIETETAATIAAIEAETAAEVAVIAAAAGALADKESVAITKAEIAKARQAGKLLVQTARRQVFDEIMSSAEAAVATDSAARQAFADQRPQLELILATELNK